MLPELIANHDKHQIVGDEQLLQLITIDDSEFLIDDTIHRNLKEQQDHSILTDEEEVWYLNQIKNANRSKNPDIIQQGQYAKADLIAHNMRLVYSIANQYRGLGIPIDDLIQEGVCGMLKAINKYDPDKTNGARFSTHAFWWVRQSINRYLTRNHSTVRIPTHLQEGLPQLHQSMNKLTHQLGRMPTLDEIACATNQDVDKLRRKLTAIYQSHSILSLNQPLKHSEDTLEDILPCPNPTPETINYLSPAIVQAINMLPDELVAVLKLRYGFNQAERIYTYREAAEILQISRTEVQNREREAVAAIRRQLKAYDF